MFAPDGRRAALLDSGSDELRLAPTQAGFYELRGGGRSQWLAVHIDPRESQLQRLADQRIDEWQQMATPAAQTGAATATQVGWIPVWFWLLLLAAGLAFIEPLVANSHLSVKREHSA